MNEYLTMIKTALDNGASDYELEEIIDEAANEIEDNKEYEEFYTAAINMLKTSGLFY